MPRGLGSSLSSHPQHRALPPQQHAGSLSQQGIMRHGGRRWTFPVRGGVSGDGYVLNGSSGSGADTCGGNGGAGAGGSCGGADHSRSLSAHPLTRDLSDLGRSASGTSLGSVSDMQQLVSAFARSAQTPPIGGAWSNGDGGATRGLSPPPPSWARAFAQSASGAISSTLGGGNGGGGGTPTSGSRQGPSSHSPPGAINSAERFLAALGGASNANGSGSGPDDLGDAAEMQLDGILDMLDKWEHFEGGV